MFSTRLTRNVSARWSASPWTTPPRSYAPKSNSSGSSRAWMLSTTAWSSSSPTLMPIPSRYLSRSLSLTYRASLPTLARQRRGRRDRCGLATTDEPVLEHLYEHRYNIVDEYAGGEVDDHEDEHHVDDHRLAQHLRVAPGREVGGGNHHGHVEDRQYVVRVGLAEVR